MEFGVSPAGVWRNRSFDPAGSDTRGAAAYDESYADTRQWVQQGLLDYIAPQIYWPFSRDAARYDVLTRWWADVVKPTHTRLYIGIAFYKVGEPSKRAGLDGSGRRAGAEKAARSQRFAAQRQRHHPVPGRLPEPAADPAGGKLSPWTLG